MQLFFREGFEWFVRIDVYKIYTVPKFYFIFYYCYLKQGVAVQLGKENV